MEAVAAAFIGPEEICLEVEREPGAYISLIGLVEYTEVKLPVCKAGLEYRAAQVRPDEIEFVAGAEIGGHRLAFDQVYIQQDRDLNPREATPVDVPDSSNEIDPLAVATQAGAHADAPAGRDLFVRCQETVHAGINAYMEQPVLLPHQGKRQE